MRTKRAVLPLAFRYSADPDDLVPPPNSTLPPLERWKLEKYYNELTTIEWTAPRASREPNRGNGHTQRHMQTLLTHDRTSSATGSLQRRTRPTSAKSLNTSNKKRDRTEDNTAKSKKKQRSNEPQAVQEPSARVAYIDEDSPSESPDVQAASEKPEPNLHKPKWSTAEKLMLFKAAEGKGITTDRDEILAAYHAAGGERGYIACLKAYRRFKKGGDTVGSLEKEIAEEQSAAE